MTNTKKLAGCAAMIAMLALPGVTQAQQHQHRDSTRQGMMMQGSMGDMHMGGMQIGDMMEGSEMMLNMMGMSPRVMRLQPNQVLAHSDQLALTDGQRLQIEQIATAQEKAHSEHMASMVGRTSEIDRLLGDDDVGETEIRAWIDGSVEFYRDMHGRMVLDALAVRGILSAEQRALALDLPLDPWAMMMHSADMMMGQGLGRDMHGHNKP